MKKTILIQIGPLIQETFQDLRLLLENHQILRALFFSETIAEILDAVPEVFRFQFCNFSSVCLIESSKNHFPSLMRLHEFHHKAH